ncbi:Gfo/Idh/MocA family protein [Leifsonia poae]|uniref:Gfo/Idh/MocA family protein n=1 Tax=Leifsonia poae TaxID=110933 RepID=UPI001CBEC829|nr:Gfo/Idh/MocA family oxidoreductase [Leifsonia poae]
MNGYRAAVIAAGGQGRVHASGYRADERVDLVAVADVNLDIARELAGEFGIESVFSDYRQMLETVRPDIVSVCTPPAFHLDAVIAAAEAGVRAVHCEKPIALSYDDALRMQAVADAFGMQFTVNLQRRFEPVHRFAREQLAAGAIGEIVTIEGYCPNLPDWGSHILDLILFYRGDAAPEWVFGQIDVSTNRYVYGAFVETASITQVAWPDGVRATVSTGREPATPVLNLENNLGLIVQGTRGRLVVRGSECIVHRFGTNDLRFASPYATDPAGWERGIDPAIFACTAAAVADLVDGLETGREPSSPGVGGSPARN